MVNNFKHYSRVGVGDADPELSQPPKIFFPDFYKLCFNPL
jgi:hypothetical protein